MTHLTDWWMRLDTLAQILSVIGGLVVAIILIIILRLLWIVAVREPWDRHKDRLKTLASHDRRGPAKGIPGPRAHDLPPRWDGRAAIWDTWHEDPPVFVCPPPPELDCCHHCGSLEPRRVSIGKVAESTLTTHSRLEHGQGHARRLTAWRCRDCHHDTILDSAGTLWDLDDTDYGKDGSWPK